MKIVYQSILDKGDGDCHRAAVASILDLTIEQVPHFNRFGNDWFGVFYNFMRTCGWEFSGTCGINADRGLKVEDSIEGYFLASVPSLTFKDVFHSIIIDLKGICIHDPNPNKKWLGKNIYNTKKNRDSITWEMFEKVNEK